jgi:hypothetical protein
MAFLQPANIPSRNDVPARLQTVARCLREFLPDEVTVWLERTEGGERRALRREFDQQQFEGLAGGEDDESYLVVLDPAAGILVLEAPARLRARRRLGRGSKTVLDRVRRLTESRVSDLRNGLDAGSLRDLPVGAAHALPDLHASEIETATLDVPVLCADDFTRQALGPAIKQVLGGPRRPIEQARQSAARAVVNPKIVIRGTQGELFAPVTDRDDEEVLRTLDRKQELLARSLGPGYRLIRGVAGSGKTLVLTCRARHMAHHFPKWRILLVCFNKALSLGLERQVAEHSNVRVQTLDALARRVLIEVGREPDDEGTPDFPRRRRDAVDAVTEVDESKLFDMVLVDEAQDLDETGLDLAWAMLKPGRDHFVMALDGAQMIYRRRMTWNPPSMTARGRTTILDVNYRNTREVLDLGQQLLAGLGREDSDSRSPDDLDVLVRPDKAVRTGLTPVCLACGDHRREAEAIADRVEELRRGGAQPDQIAVLLGTEEVRRDVVRLVPDVFDTRKGRNRNRIFDVRGKVRVATLGLLKGLEFRHVIVGGANQISVHTAQGESAEEVQRRLLYVGVTRATETLTITYSGAGIMSVLEGLPRLDA